MTTTGRTRISVMLTGLAWLVMPWLPFAMADDPPPDVVIVDARIWTGSDKPQGRKPTALAITGNKITVVGDDKAIRRLATSKTTIISAGGRRLIPGMTDAHTHIVSGGFQLDRLTLRDVKDRADFVSRVRRAAAAKQAGEWVLGGRWSVDSWSDQSSPTKAWIDEVTGTTPVLLSRMDGHQALVNSAALKLAAIDGKGPPDPIGGEIVRDPATNEPTGILKESAMELVAGLIPEPGTKQRLAALKRAMRHANSLGITSVHDMSDPDDLPSLLAAHGDKILTLRITSYPQFEDWQAGMKAIKKFPVADEMLTIAGLKGYMDGSLGSRTAYMRDPFDDASSGTLHPNGQLSAFASDARAFQEHLRMVHAAGLQIAVHAIGDQANHLLLNAYESLAPSTGAARVHHRVEHAQHLRVEDVPRFEKLGVIASMQPLHKADDGRYAEIAIGAARLEGSYAYRKLVDSGALLIFGSDWPVVSINPFLGIDAAVSAKTLEGKVWLASHSLTREEALSAYTRSPPEAIGRGASLGRIEPGRLADVVLLQQDVLSIPEDQIGKVKVYMTLVDGRIVYSQ